MAMRASMSCKGEILVNGYVNTDGVLSPIVRGEAHAELDGQMVHRRIDGVFHDELGREMRLEARYAAGWSMPIQHLLLNEVGMAATLDGVVQQSGTISLADDGVVHEVRIVMGKP